MQTIGVYILFNAILLLSYSGMMALLLNLEFEEYMRSELPNLRVGDIAWVSWHPGEIDPKHKAQVEVERIFLLGPRKYCKVIYIDETKWYIGGHFPSIDCLERDIFLSEVNQMHRKRPIPSMELP